jgi:SPP1 family predicted phage head-tail adaptor
MERHREVFNDGYLVYGRKKTQRSSNAKRVGDLFVQEGKLAYKEVSARESDFQMSGLMGAKLDLKVKTLYPPSFKSLNKNKLTVIIQDVGYDVIKVDPDNVNRHLYFYLQEVGGHSE